MTGIPMTATPFLPSSAWGLTNGSVTLYQAGWQIDAFAFAFGFAVTVLVLLCLLLVTEKRLRFTSVMQRILSNRTHLRSGLYGTTSSLAGLTFCFQDGTVRQIFEDVDRMENDEAKNIISSRLKFHILFLREWK